MIEFKNVTKKYRGNKTVLDKVCFSIKKGQFVFLIGPSGAGKTTLLNMLVAAVKPSSGSIIYKQNHVERFKTRNIVRLRREVRMVFQDFKVLFDRTTIENVKLSLYILGRRDREASMEAKKALKLVGLKDKEDFYPVQLSAGELQRVAIARALAGGSEVLLADEPTGNLDPKTGKEIIHLLKEINQEGTTVIMATHDKDLVDTTKKRVVELKNGKVVRDDKEGTYETAS